MGRPKSKHKDLPPRMVARVYPSGRIAYYYNPANARRIPLGDNLAKAKLEWARLEHGAVLDDSFRAIATAWRAAELTERSPATQAQYIKYLEALLDAFGHIPLDAIEPVHCQQYLAERSAKVMANREISLLSTIFSWARRTGRTRAANPLHGVTKNRERPRRVYVTDEEFKRVHARAIGWVQDAMDLALLTGQRSADVLKMTRQDIRDGYLWVEQNKTGTRQQIEVVGELKAAIERATTRPRTSSSMYLVADDRGQPITVDRLQKQFLAARGDATWQFRDLRKKTASDSSTIREAKELLGHATEVTTGRVYRQVKGLKVKPLR